MKGFNPVGKSFRKTPKGDSPKGKKPREEGRRSNERNNLKQYTR